MVQGWRHNHTNIPSANRQGGLASFHCVDVCLGEDLGMGREDRRDANPTDRLTEVCSGNGLRVKTQRVKLPKTSQKKAIFREDFEDIQKYFKIQ